MRSQIDLPPEARVEERVQHSLHEVLPDIAYQRIAFVNAAFAGDLGAGDRRWLLIDAGLKGGAGAIRRAAAHRFGDIARPFAIILTHGHFDHVGALHTLLHDWDVPVFAHELEFPYLDGSVSYPPPNPWVGGMMALTSPLLPRGPIDISDRLHRLPEDGSIPGMPGWRWIHTPGHTPGHVSLWRDLDRTLLAGDAFVTTHQESAYAAITQSPEMHGPPAYFTPDWTSAAASVRKLAALEPELVITGHGRAMHGEPMRRALHTLADNFERVAVPPSRHAQCPHPTSR